MAKTGRKKRDAEFSATGFNEAWRDAERHARAIAQDFCPNWATCYVRLAVKGGWKVGFTWSGNFRVTFDPREFGKPCACGWRKTTASMYWDGGIEEFRRILERPSVQHVRRISRGCMLVALFRRGPIDAKETKPAARELKDRFPGSSIYEDQEYQLEASRVIAGLLIERGFTETERGWLAPEKDREFCVLPEFWGWIGL